MTTRPHPKQLATGTPEDGYTVQYSSGDSIWIPTTNSVFGRTGDVVAATDDYSSSQIDNDSTCTGEQVSDALEYLDGYVASVADDVAGISTMAVSGDLSGNMPNPTVTDLTITSEEEGSVLYFDGYNWVQLPPGTDGYILTTHGNNPPTWEESSGGASSGTPFTVTTVTEGVSVELAMAVDLPSTPAEGDISVVGMLIEATIARANGEAYAISYWVAFTFSYSSSAWTCDGGNVIGRSFAVGTPYYPSGSVFLAGYGSSLPQERTTAPVEFTTEDDTDGLFVVKGTYRQISRIDFEA